MRNAWGNIENAPRCFKCKKPIVAGGLFSGSYYTIEEKERSIKNAIRIRDRSDIVCISHNMKYIL